MPSRSIRTRLRGGELRRVPDSGQNHKACGYASPFEFVLAMCQTEGAQLLAFVNFLKTNRLDAALRENRWADFARGYNGSAYKANPMT
jgi:hypothetical protein